MNERVIRLNEKDRIARSTTRDCYLHPENPDRVISWSKAIGIMHTVTGFGTYEADYSVPNFIILFVEVEVDTGTGAVEAGPGWSLVFAALTGGNAVPRGVRR